MTLDERRDLVSTQGVTLDGKPARIMGARNTYAAVATIPTGPAYEFAWVTVRRIVANGGAFRS